MKKKLLTPPQNNQEIVCLPGKKEIQQSLTGQSRVGVCHQPYFFNPGVSLKFLALDNLPQGEKKIVFLDTDRAKLNVRVPYLNTTRLIEFINSESVLYDYGTPGLEDIITFCDELEGNLKDHCPAAVDNFLVFKNIFIRNCNKGFLKQVLAESFLEFYGLEGEYCFVSDLVKTYRFRDFFLTIYNDNQRFQELFNQALDDYRKIFRFRYKNSPFPRLEEDELPFWLVENGRRVRCFKKDVNEDNYDKLTIFPRACSLTLFLRLYELDLFIHGIGGGNYEWVQDELIERFFKKQAGPYMVISGTFLLGKFKERQLPYFLFKPDDLKQKARLFWD